MGDVKLGWGAYSSAATAWTSRHGVHAVACRQEQPVFGLFTALQLHNLWTVAADIWIVRPAHTRRPSVPGLTIRVLWADQPDEQDLQTAVFDGSSLTYTTVLRTLADILRVRDRIGLDVALEAVRTGVSAGALRLDDLWTYLDKRGQLQTVEPFLQCAVR